MNTNGYLEEIQAFQSTMDQQLRAPDGWLTLAGLDWLQPGDNLIGSARACTVSLPPYSAPQKVGVLTLTDGKVYYQPEAGIDSRINGATVKDRVQLETDIHQEPTQVTLGDLTFFAIVRGERIGIRIKQVSHPRRLNFPGRVWWPIDPNFRVQARIEPYQPPKMVIIPDILGDENETGIDCALVFNIENRQFSLDAFGMPGGQYYIMFHDLSCGKGSYPPGRFLVTEIAADDSVVIDFNKAYNPPCAFTPFATCPLPPSQNYLQAEIRAGERYQPLKD